jgi:uncharacterized RDD family membrane protein YckC
MRPPAPLGKLARMDRATSARDVALGVVATGARLGAAAAWLVLLPARAAVRAPVVGPRLRRTEEGFGAEGREARTVVSGRLEATVQDLLAAPEVARAVDAALASPLAESAARSFAEHRVAERVAAQIVATPEFEEAVAAALEHEATRRLVDRALASPGLERLVVDTLTAELTDRILHGPELQRAVEEVAASPAVRAALARQTTSLADEVAAAVRRRAELADDGAERRLGRRTRDAPTAFAGIATRAIGFAIDVALAFFLFIAGAAMVALVASLVGELRPRWLVATLVGAGWTLVAGGYFVLFWTTTGQTPGMRAMRLRVRAGDGRPPGLARSIGRLLGLLLAIVPMFAGFLPVLFDRRRRGLHDLLAGTVVVYAGRAAPAAPAAPDAAARLSVPAPLSSPRS